MEPTSVFSLSNVSICLYWLIPSVYNGNKFGGNGIYFVFTSFVRQTIDASVIIVQLSKQYIFVHLMAFNLFIGKII